MKLNGLLNPVVVVILSVAAGFVIWAIPGSSAPLRGFAYRAQLTWPGILIILGRYTFCILLIRAGMKVGKRVLTFDGLARFETEPKLVRVFYFGITVAAVIGVLYSFVEIAQSVSIIGAIRSQTINSLAAALPGRTSIATLRYATAIAAPIGVYLWQRKRAPLWMAILNTVLLLANAALASRMTVIVAILVYIFLFVRSRPRARLKLWVGLVSLAVSFSGLTAFHYLRNANFYEADGLSNPLLMNAHQIGAYFAAPAQVSIGVADAIANGELTVLGDPIGSLPAVAPTFFRLNKPTNGSDNVAAQYGDVVSLANYYNANSAFADGYASYGWWGLGYICLAPGISGFIFGVFSRYRSIVAVVAAVVLSGFSELWRLFMFNQGVYLFLLLATAGGVLGASDLAKFISRRPMRLLFGGGNHDDPENDQGSELGPGRRAGVDS